MEHWVISDTHFGHKNIIEFCNRPKNHNELMLENWHNLVAPEDTILHLGDVFMGAGSKEFAEKFIPELPGHKMLIFGNHDKAPLKFYTDDLGFELFPQPQMMGKTKPYRVALTHYPLCGRYAEWDMNIHGHIHTSGYAPGTPPNRSYVNVSVEVTGYAPVLLDDVRNGLNGQHRKDAQTWPFSMTYEMSQKGRLDEHFCELDRSRKL